MEDFHLVVTLLALMKEGLEGKFRFIFTTLFAVNLQFPGAHDYDPRLRLGQPYMHSEKIFDYT